MRGVIIQLLLTLTLNRFKEGWVICAAKFNGIIYLCINPTKVKTDYEANMTEKQKKQTYWGSKFEQYILRGTYIILIIIMLLIEIIWHG